MATKPIVNKQHSNLLHKLTYSAYYWHGSAQFLVGGDIVFNIHSKHFIYQFIETVSNKEVLHSLYPLELLFSSAIITN